jgi:hypothetical protein
MAIPMPIAVPPKNEVMVFTTMVEMSVVKLWGVCTTIPLKISNIVREEASLNNDSPSRTMDRISGAPP